MEDNFQIVLDAVGQDALNRTSELIDYAVIRLDSLLDQEFPDASKEDAEAALRTIIRSVREAVDKFELGMADERFWDAWDDDHDEDKDEDTPYWGGSNEHN